MSPTFSTSGLGSGGGVVVQLAPTTLSRDDFRFSVA